MTKHILTISPDYVPDWGLWEAVRELLQNAIDQHALNPESMVTFDYDPATETLRVGASNCHLEPKTLLMGSTDKVGKGTIGKFGEGYKLAMLVLQRLSYEVVIENGDETWTPGLEHSEEFGCRVLVVTRTPASHDSGVWFTVRDVSEDGFGKITENYLPGPTNVLLDEDHLLHRVFIGGLFVMVVPELEFGYNFDPHNVHLNRDRSAISIYDIAWAARSVWKANGDDDRFYRNFEAGGLDTSQVTPSEGGVLLERYLASTDAIPVATDEEESCLQAAGNVTRKVTTGMRDFLRNMHPFQIKTKKSDPRVRLEAFDVLFGDQLGIEGRKEFKTIVAESSRWAIKA